MWNRTSSRLLLVTAACLLTVLNASADLTDSAPHVPANYLGFVPPARGQSYTDAVFGSSVKRLSSALGSPNNADGGNLLYVLDEYSTVSAFNRDRSRFILQHDSYFALYDGQGSYLRDLPWAVHASSEPRWSRSDDRTLYFLNGNQLKKVDTVTSAVSTVRTFSEYGRISGHGESDICFDGNHLVLAGDSRYVFIYELSTNAKGPVLDVGSRSFDSLYITPDDRVTVTWLTSGSGRYNGIELFSSNMVFQRQLTRAGGHMDITRDTDGSEVLVWANAADPNPVCDNGVVKVRLSDGRQTCLQTYDWNLGIHVSCPDGNGSCIVGTYAPSDPMPGSGWPAYTNELMQVMLDGSPTRRLAHHRSRPFNGYNYMPKATVSRDGAQLVFASNFGLQGIQGAPSEYSDAYLLSLTGGGTGGGTGAPIFADGFETGGMGRWSGHAP